MTPGSCTARPSSLWARFEVDNADHENVSTRSKVTHSEGPEARGHVRTLGGRSPLTYHYFARWNPILDQPMDSLSSDEAARRFEVGPWFSVGVSEDPHFGQPRIIPSAILELEPRATAAAVWFYAIEGTVTLRYNFRQIHGRLFLTNAVTYDYADSRKHTLDESVQTENMHFNPNGDVVTHRRIKATQTVQKAEQHGVDVTGNWEEIPRFGEWDSLLRWERESTA